ncbi:MAG: hypothetical protein J7K53_11105, partial [Bacteroidales bacterium]|nr:hypothetical protein [Bacteroidales bacterium]
ICVRLSPFMNFILKDTNNQSFNLDFYHKVMNKIKRFLDSLTVNIRIVANCGNQNFQFTMKLKRATTLEFTTKPAIIFIYC